MARTELRNHPKFKRLLKRLKLPVPHVVGLLELMWHSCYESGNDVIGNSEDVELAAEWGGQPGRLFKALLECGTTTIDGRLGAGFIEPVPLLDGLYRVHDLRDHAPDYVQKKLDRRRNKDLGKKTAVNDRDLAVNDPMTQTQTSNRQVTDTDTLPTGSAAGAATGRSPEPPSEPSETGSRKPRKQPTGTHHEVIAHFCECWKRRYGCEYPFQDGRDGKHIKDLRKRVKEDLRAAKLVIDRYFESDDPYLVKDRHSPGMLVSQIRKFLVTTEDALSGAAQVYPSDEQAESWVKP